ncbi:Ulp1 peptidase [Trifolium repens]|nr:Ulp1 peptidase [Trifolium repens]
MIACDTLKTTQQRKIAVLLIIIRLVIMLADDSRIPKSYVELLENVDDVSSYAWGAALLSYLVTGLRKFVEDYDDKKKMCGNA